MSITAIHMEKGYPDCLCIFDISKPFSISWLAQRIHEGTGIMMDDVIAGLYGLVSLQLLWLIVGRFFI